MGSNIDWLQRPDIKNLNRKLANDWNKNKKKTNLRQTKNDIQINNKTKQMINGVNFPSNFNQQIAQNSIKKLI
jgi:hypothetical protein